MTKLEDHSGLSGLASCNQQTLKSGRGWQKSELEKCNGWKKSKSLKQEKDSIYYGWL